MTFYHCLFGLGDGPHPCTEGTTQHDTRHDIGFSEYRLKIQLWHRAARLATNSLKPNYQDLNGNLLLKTFKMYINRHFKLLIAHKEMSLGCFLLFPALRTSVSESFDFLKKTRENSCFLHCQKNIQNSTLPLLQFLQIFACPEAEDYSFLAKRIENLNLALLSVCYPSRRTNESCYSWLDRIKWLFMYVFTV